MKKMSYALILIFLCALAAHAEDFTDIGKQMKSERDAREKELWDSSTRKVKMYNESQRRLENQLEIKRKARISNGSDEERAGTATPKKNKGKTLQKVIFCATGYIVFKGPNGEKDDYNCEADCKVSACTAQELIDEGWLVRSSTPTEIILRNGTEVGGEKRRVLPGWCERFGKQCYQDNVGWYRWEVRPQYIGCKCPGNEFILER